MKAPSWRFAATRAIALAVAIVILVTIEGAGVASAKSRGRDLSVSIRAVRAAQIAAESSMRSADVRLRTLKQARRKAERNLRKMRRRRDDVIDRRTEARDRAGEARALVEAARADLEQEEEALAALLVQRDVIDMALAAPSAASAALGLAPATVSATQDRSAQSRAGDAAGDDAAIARLEASVADLESDVARAAAQSHRIDRATRRVERTTRRAGRREAGAKRRIRNVKAGMRSAAVQQQGAEASLASHIRSMTRLAFLRANKKTRGRVARNFIMPVHGRLSQGYHAGHDGLDIVAGRGTPIRAMGPGVITYVGWNPWDSRPRAFIVVIAHQGGYETQYGHLLPRRGITLGELVRRGEVIGYMGNTGHSTGVHLHLEVSRGFHTINPYSIL